MRYSTSIYFFIVIIIFFSTAVFADEINNTTNQAPSLISEQKMLKSEPQTQDDKEMKGDGLIHLSTKGYYKNIPLASRSFSSNKPYFAELQRFRIEPTIDIGDVQIYAALDNEMINGNFVKTADFDLVKQKSEKNLDWLPVQWTLIDEKENYYTTYLYRGYIRYYDPKFQIIAGKQNINWGRCHFWSPMDLFNPNSPLDIEKDERVGVDAASITASITDLVSLDLIYVPYGALKKSGFATRTLCRIENYDVFLMVGQFKEDNVIGACIDGYLGGASIREECTYTWEHGGNKFFRSVTGIDYTFPNKLRMGGEYFFNGAATDINKDIFLSSYQYSAHVLTMRKNLIGAQVGYDLSPLLKWDNYVIFDLDGRSIFLNPELKYNMKPNLDITLGVQIFSGIGSSEFGEYKDVYYAELKYYF